MDRYVDMETDHTQRLCAWNKKSHVVGLILSRLDFPKSTSRGWNVTRDEANRLSWFTPHVQVVSGVPTGRPYMHHLLLCEWMRDPGVGHNSTLQKLSHEICLRRLTCVTKRYFWITWSFSRAMSELVSPWPWEEITQWVSPEWNTLNGVQSIGTNRFPRSSLVLIPGKGICMSPWPWHCSSVCSLTTPEPVASRCGFPLVSLMPGEGKGFNQVSSWCTQRLFIWVCLCFKNAWWLSPSGVGRMWDFSDLKPIAPMSYPFSFFWYKKLTSNSNKIFDLQHIKNYQQ